MRISTLILLTTLALVACDEPTRECELPSGSLALVSPDDSAPTGPTFREQGPPEALVLKTYGGDKILREQFVDLILSVGDLDDPPLTCTMSWYQPDVAKPEYTAGIGCSTRMPVKLWDSYRSTFLKNGAAPP